MQGTVNQNDNPGVYRAVVRGNARMHLDCKALKAALTCCLSTVFLIPRSRTARFA